MPFARSLAAALALSVLLPASLAAAERKLIGRGSLATIAAGPGVDLVAWIGNGRLLVARVGASGLPGTLTPVDLGAAPSPLRPAAAWDGATFVIATGEPAGIRIRRVSLEGSPAGDGLIPSGPADDLALASRGDGAALLAWSRYTGPLEAVLLRPGVAVGSAVTETIASDADFIVEAVALGDGYLLAWPDPYRCRTLCPDPLPHEGIRLARLDAAGLPEGPSIRVTGEFVSDLSLASGDGGLLAFTRSAEPAVTRLRRNPAGSWSEGAVPFVMPLRAETSQGEASLTADGLRLELGESLRASRAWWVPLAGGEESVGTLPASGRHLVEGNGEIAIYAPSAKIADIAFTITHSSADAHGGTLRVKVENRGPDAPEWAQIWVTGQVVRASAPLTNAELVHSSQEWSAVRLRGPLHRGTGYEVFLTFAPPFDPSTVGVWYYPDGVDPDPSNNVLFPPIAMEEEPPARRRSVRR